MAASPTRVVLQILLTVLAVATGTWALYRLERLVLLLVLAAFLAYLIAPFVELAQRPIRIAGRTRRLSRGLAIAIVYLIIIGAAATAAVVLVPRVTQQIGDAVSQTPVYATSLRAWEQRWARSYEQSNVPAEVRQTIDRSVLGAGDTAIEYARGSLIALVGGLAYLPWLGVGARPCFFSFKGRGHVPAYRPQLVAAPFPAAWPSVI